MTDVTQILSQIEQGDPHAADQLLPLVCDELRKLAAAKMAREEIKGRGNATRFIRHSNEGDNPLRHSEQGPSRSEESMSRLPAFCAWSSSFVPVFSAPSCSEILIHQRWASHHTLKAFHTIAQPRGNAAQAG